MFYKKVNKKKKKLLLVEFWSYLTMEGDVSCFAVWG